MHDLHQGKGDITHFTMLYKDMLKYVWRVSYPPNKQDRIGQKGKIR